MGEVVRRLDIRKNSNKAEVISAMAEVQTGIGGNGNKHGSGRRRELGVTIATKRRWQDDSNNNSSGLGASLVWFGGSV